MQAVPIYNPLLFPFKGEPVRCTLEMPPCKERRPYERIRKCRGDQSV